MGLFLERRKLWLRDRRVALHERVLHLIDRGNMRNHSILPGQAFYYLLQLLAVVFIYFEFFL